MKERHQLLKIGGKSIPLPPAKAKKLIDGGYNGKTVTFGILGEGLGAEGSLAIGSAIGGGVAGVMMVITIIGAALYVITGLLGFKGNSLTACKVLGIIVLVLAVIGFIGSLGTILLSPVSFIINLLVLVISLIYVIGAFKSVKE